MAEVYFPTEVDERIEEIVMSFPCLTYAIAITGPDGRRIFQRTMLDDEDEVISGTAYMYPDKLTQLRTEHFAIDTHRRMS
jgi:hypothetical protein